MEYGFDERRSQTSAWFYLKLNQLGDIMFNINQSAPMYDQNAVQPMRDELIYVGFEELFTPQDVENAFEETKAGTMLVLINSVCGCAAGSARPGATLALQNDIIPDKIVTVFAGQEREAVSFFRDKFTPKVPPSSPSMFLYKSGELVFALQRYDIEGRTQEEIAKDLVEAFNENCKTEGPSISPEAYAELIHAKMCGSKIPLNRN